MVKLLKVSIIVVSVLVSVVVILLIVFFSCKRGCKCCDNLCCDGRCHTTEAEKEAIEQEEERDVLDSYFECITSCSWVGGEDVECVSACISTHFNKEHEK